MTPTLPPLPPTDPKIMAIQPVETMPNGERIHWPMEYHIGFKDARRAAAVVAAAERASLLAVLKQAGEALTTSLKQLETLAGKRRKHPNEGQDAIHAEVLEIVDAALAEIKALEQ